MNKFLQTDIWNTMSGGPRLDVMSRSYLVAIGQQQRNDDRWSVKHPFWRCSKVVRV